MFGEHTELGGGVEGSREDERRPPQNFFVAITEDGKVVDIGFSDYFENMDYGEDIMMYLGQWKEAIKGYQGKIGGLKKSRIEMSARTVKEYTGYSPLEIYGEMATLFSRYKDKPEEELPPGFYTKAKPKHKLKRKR